MAISRVLWRGLRIKGTNDWKWQYEVKPLLFQTILRPPPLVVLGRTYVRNGSLSLRHPLVHPYWASCVLLLSADWAPTGSMVAKSASCGQLKREPAARHFVVSRGKRTTRAVAYRKIFLHALLCIARRSRKCPVRLSHRSAKYRIGFQT